MDYWEIKRGNTVIQDIPIYGLDGVTLVDNLDEVAAAKFQIKKEKTSTSTLVEKTLVSGIDVDTPNTGYIQLTLLPSDTKVIPKGTYYIGLELTWDADTEYEIDFTIDDRETDQCKIVEDVVK